MARAGLAQQHEAQHGAAGFTLAEVMIALAVLSIAAVGVLALLAHTLRLSALHRERTLAQDAVRSVAEDMLSRTVQDAWARYNEFSWDNPPDPMNPVTGGPWGPHFHVPGLRSLPGDRDGHVGRVIFPATDAGVSEQVVDAALGMPRDLNGNGGIDARPITDFKILPVRIVVEWQRPAGQRGLFVAELLLGNR